MKSWLRALLIALGLIILTGCLIAVFIGALYLIILTANYSTSLVITILGVMLLSVATIIVKYK